jgi:hypothetical protein
MKTPKRLIEVDEATAAALETRAAECGLSVPDLIAKIVELTTSEETIPDEVEAGEPSKA